MFTDFEKPNASVLPAFVAAGGLRLMELVFRAGVTGTANHMVENWSMSDLDLRALLISYQVPPLRCATAMC